MASLSKRILTILVLVALLPFLTGATIVIRGPRVAAGGGTPVLIESVKGQSTDSSGFTTDPIDTSGANLIVVNVAASEGSNPQITDSKGNTWTQLAASSVGGAQCSLFYVYAPTVGSGHTFTVGNGYPSIQVAAFSNISASPFDQQAGATNTSWTTIQVGSITPTQANTLSIVGLCFEQPTSAISIDDSYTIAETSQGGTSVAYGGSIAYKVLTSTTAQAPTWTSTVSNGNGSTRIANFKY